MKDKTQFEIAQKDNNIKVLFIYFKSYLIYLIPDIDNLTLNHDISIPVII